MGGEIHHIHSPGDYTELYTRKWRILGHISESCLPQIAVVLIGSGEVKTKRMRTDTRE